MLKRLLDLKYKMLDVAYIFPGQGAQYVGMGLDFYNQYPQAKEVFERANSTLGFNLTKLIFNGPADDLIRTDNCQVAIFVTSLAYFFTLSAQDISFNVKFSAGLSLGEYTALVAAEALSFEEGLRLVRKRGQYMDQAAQDNPGGMLSIIGLSVEVVENICRQTKTEIANLNCPGQVVISGSLKALEEAKVLAVKSGARKSIPLQVGGAFHCSLMGSAAQKLHQDLMEIKINAPKIDVVNNVKATVEKNPQAIKDNLAEQVAHRTRWEDSISLISAAGVKHFLEIGPGKVLKGLLRKIDPELSVYNIGTVQELEELEKVKTLR